MGIGQTIAWSLVPLGEGWDLSYQDAVVWVDMAKLDAAWRRDSGYVGLGGRGSLHPGRYESVGRWIVRTGKLFMPCVSLGSNDEVTFTDGRHRVAWLRDHGVKALRVAVCPSEAETFVAQFGTSCRKSTWQVA